MELGTFLRIGPEWTLLPSLILHLLRAQQTQPLCLFLVQLLTVHPSRLPTPTFCFIWLRRRAGECCHLAGLRHQSGTGFTAFIVGIPPGSFVLYCLAYFAFLLCCFCFYRGIELPYLQEYLSPWQLGILIQARNNSQRKIGPLFSTVACRCMGIKILAWYYIAGSNVKAKKQVLLIF